MNRSEGAGAPRRRQLVGAEAGPVLGAQAVDGLQAIGVNATKAYKLFEDRGSVGRWGGVGPRPKMSAWFLNLHLRLALRFINIPHLAARRGHGRGIRKSTFRHYDISQGYPSETSFLVVLQVQGWRPHTPLFKGDVLAGRAKLNSYPTGLGIPPGGKIQKCVMAAPYLSDLARGPRCTLIAPQYHL